MAEQFQTSFIPKKVVEQKSNHVSMVGIFLTISIVLLVISLASVGGVLLYEKYLTSSLASKKEDLQQQREAFAPELIRDMARLDRKLATSQQLLKGHVSVTGIFELLQDLTLKTVRFTNLVYSQGDEGIQVTLKGEGQSFTSVALQSDEFGKSSALSEAVFSSFQLNERGNVNFSVTAIVNPSVVSFTERKERGIGAVSVEVVPDTVSTAVDSDTPASGTTISQDATTVIGG
ncbi:MAG: hypothetical protein NUW02_02875 [Candidatus Campbellbacteria bacterium]|nr:hypothetical protein [Candidatus Campbellbacteria bacterium]